jgi:putative addiction module component (TIGR02574 family)
VSASGTLQIVMMAKPKIDLHDLTPAERLELAGELWDSLDDGPESIPLTPAQVRELDRRVGAYRTDREAGRPWREVLDEIEARYKPPSE